VEKGLVNKQVNGENKIKKCAKDKHLMLAPGILLYARQWI